MEDIQSPKKLGALQNRIQILSTRPIDPDQINASKELGIDIDCISFIETTAIENNELTKKIKGLLESKATVVFTSMNAIDVVATHLSTTKPDWRIYCMGVTSNQLIKQYFGEHAVIGTATNSEDLAKLIIAEKKSNEKKKVRRPIIIISFEVLRNAVKNDEGFEARRNKGFFCF